VTPLSIAAAADVDGEWRMWNGAIGDEGGGSLACRLEAYIEVVVWTSVVYVFVWMCVDRLTALEKPSRYEMENSSTRCKCWIGFSWLSAVLLACPIVAAQMRTRYDDASYMCMLDWASTTRAFRCAACALSAHTDCSVTLAILVLVPTLSAVIGVYYHIFRHMYNPADLEDQQKMLLDTDHNFMVTFFIILSFALSWLPWFGAHLFAVVADESLDNHQLLRFSFTWLAMSAGLWKMPIYTVLNPQFRRALYSFVTVLFCGCCMPLPPPLPPHPHMLHAHMPAPVANNVRQHDYDDKSYWSADAAAATTMLSMPTSNNYGTINCHMQQPLNDHFGPPAGHMGHMVAMPTSHMYAMQRQATPHYRPDWSTTVGY
jgi:hypothetical protein